MLKDATESAQNQSGILICCKAAVLALPHIKHPVAKRSHLGQHDLRGFKIFLVWSLEHVSGFRIGCPQPGMTVKLVAQKLNNHTPTLKIAIHGLGVPLRESIFFADTFVATRFVVHVTNVNACRVTQRAKVTTGHARRHSQRGSGIATRATLVALAVVACSTGSACFPFYLTQTTDAQ